MKWNQIKFICIRQRGPLHNNTHVQPSMTNRQTGKYIEDTSYTLYYIKTIDCIYKKICWRFHPISKSKHMIMQ